MTGLRPAWAALFFACAVSGAGAGSVAPEAAGFPAHCANVTAGAETRTICAPAAPAPPGSAVACHNYTVGSDTHAECTAVAAPGLGGSRPWQLRPVLPASALRCSTYHIGSSVYTDCR